MRGAARHKIINQKKGTPKREKKRRKDQKRMRRRREKAEDQNQIAINQMKILIHNDSKLLEGNK